MKKAIFLAILVSCFTSCLSQIVYVGASPIFHLAQDRRDVSFDMGYTYRISKLGIGLDAGIASGKYTNLNLQYSTSLYLYSKRSNSIIARAGFGLGHVFTKDITDHNYHTYLFGLRAEKQVSNWSLYLEPSLNWRSYSAHIRFDPDRAWIQVKMGVSFDLLFL